MAHTKLWNSHIIRSLHHFNQTWTTTYVIAFIKLRDNYLFAIHFPPISMWVEMFVSLGEEAWNVCFTRGLTSHGDIKTKNRELPNPGESVIRNGVRHTEPHMFSTYYHVDCLFHVLCGGRKRGLHITLQYNIDCMFLKTTSTNPILFLLFSMENSHQLYTP